MEHSLRLAWKQMSANDWSLTSSRYLRLVQIHLRLSILAEYQPMCQCFKGIMQHLVQICFFVSMPRVKCLSKNMHKRLCKPTQRTVLTGECRSQRNWCRHLPNLSNVSCRSNKFNAWFNCQDTVSEQRQVQHSGKRKKETYLNWK